MTDKGRKTRGKPKHPDVVIPAPADLAEMPTPYKPLLIKLKQEISQARLRIVQSANQSMILLYWQIGQEILEQQGAQPWGAKVIDRLSHDLKTAFPDMSGFSPRNLKYMRKFAQSWPDPEFVQRTVAQIAWGSNLTLLDKLNTPARALMVCR